MPQLRDWEAALTTELRNWLPLSEQILAAIRLDFTLPPAIVARLRAAEEAESDAKIETDSYPNPNLQPFVIPLTPLDISMRQGMGLVVVMALMAGLIPFFANWIMAAAVGTAIPIANWARFAVRLGEIAPSSGGAGAIIAETAQSIAGLSTLWPGWLAAGFSALGEWINWPLRWLAVWIIYGAGTLTAAHLLGSSATLQRFYAATSYAAVPLLLLGLTPIPCLGAMAWLIGVLWALLVYGAAVRTVCGLDVGRTLLAILLPAAFAALCILLLSAFSVMIVIG